MLNLLRRKSPDFSCLAPGFFLGSFTGLLKAINCLFRRFFGESERVESSLISGFIAGFMSSFLYPSKSLSIYILCKTLEVNQTIQTKYRTDLPYHQWLYYFFFQVVCKRGVSIEVLPNIPLAKEIIYATATSILFHLAVVSPHKLKPSYFKFMNKITGNRYTTKKSNLCTYHIV